MIKKEFKIINETGVHARPATSLVTLSSKFKCDIKLTANKHTVDLKSIIGVMSLGVFKDNIIEISFNGVDEADALTAITNLLNETGIAKEL